MRYHGMWTCGAFGDDDRLERIVRADGADLCVETFGNSDDPPILLRPDALRTTFLGGK